MDESSDPVRSAGDPGTVALRRNVAFRWLWVARGVSSFGDSLSLVALLIFVGTSTGQAFAVAALLLVGDFAPALLGPLSGALSDRFDRVRLMVSAEMVQGATVVLMAVLLPPLPVLLVLVALRAVAGQIFQPAVRSAVPALVADQHLSSANSTLGFVTNGAAARGPLVAAALFSVIGVRGVLLIDAATFLISAAMLVRLGALPAATGGTADGPRVALLSDAAAGLRYLARARLIRAIIGGFVAVVACNGVDDVALVFLTRNTLGAGDSAVALLYGAVAVGLLAGYLVLARRTAGSSLTALFLAGCAVSSLGNLLTGLAWAVVMAVLVQALRGLGLSAIDIGVTTFLQRAVNPAMIGRVFGVVYGAVGVAAATSYLVGAVLLTVTDPRVTFVAAGAGGLLATAVTAVAVSRISAVARSGGQRPPESS